MGVGVVAGVAPAISGNPDFERVFRVQVSYQSGKIKEALNRPF